MAIATVSELLTPIEVVQELALAHQWEVERSQEDELLVFVEGRYSEYEVAFSWLEDL